MNHIITNQTELESICIARATSIIGHKWTSLILLELTAGPKRFCQLETSLGINPRTLSQRLDDLENHDIVTRSCTARPEYCLTAKGHDLTPILRQMSEWGDKYYSKGC